MKITDVKVFRTATPVHKTAGTNWLFVRIDTDAGISGWGEGGTCECQTFKNQKTGTVTASYFSFVGTGTGRIDYYEYDSISPTFSKNFSWN